MFGRNNTPNSHGKESLHTKKKKQLLTKKNLSLKTRKNVAKSYISNVLMYGSETCTLKHKIKKVEAMEMWTWRRLYFVLV